MFTLLKAEKREILGSSEARRIRKANRIPAIIYSKNGNINFSLDVKEFEHEYFKGNSLTSLFEIELDGKKIKVIAHKVELDPVSDRPIHVDFFNREESKSLRAKPKLIFINQEKSPGLKKGGLLHVVLRKVEVICESEKSIPEKIEVDIGSMQVGHKVRASNLKLSSGVKLAKKDNFLVASIIGRGKAEEEEKAVTDAATPAAGAAAAPAPAAAKAEADKKAKSDKK